MQICIFKDLKKYILDGLKEEKTKLKLKKFQKEKKFNNFDILLYD